MKSAERKKNNRIRLLMLGLASLLFSSCSIAGAKTNPAERGMEAPVVQNETPLSIQVQKEIQSGMVLSLEEAELVFPGKKEGADNVIDLESSRVQIQLNSLSLHGLNLSLDAPLNYNGLQRDFNLTLHEENLYFSLDASKDASADYDIRYRTSLKAYDIGEVEETTRGISYYEYGDLDYVLSEIFAAMEIAKLSLFQNDSGSKFVVDWNLVLDSLEEVEIYDDSRFLWNLPLNDKVYPVGLVHDETNTFTGIEFPLVQNGNQGYAEFSSGLKARFQCCLETASAPQWTLPYDESEYTPLSDSLSLFKKIAAFSKKRAFGVDASFTLAHTEDAVVGDEQHFAHDAVDEDCYFNLSADCDFQSGLLDALHIDASIGQLGGSEKDILLHSEPAENKEGTDFFLNVNDILKVRTNSLVVSALYDSLTDALSDPAIQNDSLQKLFSSLASTASAITKAIDAFQNTKLFKNIGRGQYQDILATIVEIKTLPNHIELSIDLGAASLEGTATVVLNGTSENAPLGSITLNNVGVRSDNDTHTSFILNGQMTVGTYEEQTIDRTGFAELSHLPEWTEEIKAIAKRDQLSAQIEGYVMTLGTTSNVTTSASYGYGRSEQGFVFSGSLAFDLVNKWGSGNMVFTDRKEGYVNDHTLKIDFTGLEEETDTDANDMSGSGNSHAMYFEYNSKNTTASSSSSAYKNENRTEPDNKNGLKGRFSTHSIAGVLEVISDLTSSTDPRFKRLTNLVSSMEAKTLLTSALDGEYFGLLTTKILSKVEILSNKTTFVIAPGVIQPNKGLTLSITYGSDNLPSIIEVSTTLEGDNAKDIYVKITLGSTSFDSFPFVFASHDNTTFRDYSSIKTLLEFGLGTITLGVTDTSTLTTYHIGGKVKISLLGISKTIDVNAWIYLDGTKVKVLAATHMPNSIVVNDETVCHIFYETDGGDTEGTLYINRLVKGKDPEHRKVKGADFGKNMMDWLLAYILNFNEKVTDYITQSDDSSKAFHGEDIVESFTVADASLSNPSWTISIGLGALAHTSMLNSLTATIYGKTATYSKGTTQYSKKSLYRLTGSTKVVIISATLDFTIKNISDSGAYSDAWNSNDGFLYYWEKQKILFVTTYNLKQTSASPANIWSGSNGKTSANSNYVNASWYVKP